MDIETLAMALALSKSKENSSGNVNDLQNAAIEALLYSICPNVCTSGSNPEIQPGQFFYVDNDPNLRYANELITANSSRKDINSLSIPIASLGGLSGMMNSLLEYVEHDANAIQALSASICPDRYTSGSNPEIEQGDFFYIDDDPYLRYCYSGSIPENSSREVIDNSSITAVNGVGLTNALKMAMNQSSNAIQKADSFNDTILAFKKNLSSKLTYKNVMNTSQIIKAGEYFYLDDELRQASETIPQGASSSDLELKSRSVVPGGIANKLQDNINSVEEDLSSLRNNLSSLKYKHGNNPAILKGTIFFLDDNSDLRYALQDIPAQSSKDVITNSSYSIPVIANGGVANFVSQSMSGLQGEIDTLKTGLLANNYTPGSNPEIKQRELFFVDEIGLRYAMSDIPANSNIETITAASEPLPIDFALSSLMQMIPMIVTPDQFGAQGNGGWDDTNSLTQMFNAYPNSAVIDGLNKTYKITELVLRHCTDLTIRNFHFYHGVSITLKSCTNIKFENCIWDEFQDNGEANKTVQCVILTTDHTGADEWVQRNNWREDEVCKNITFDNCQFIGTHFTESTPSLYENNKPHYNTGMCLRLEGVDGLYVRNCLFTQNRGNACIHQNCNAPLGDFEITNNLFYLNCWGGISLYRYTGMSAHPTRVIQNNRFIGHGLGYLPWDYLEQIPENERGVGTAVLYGGHNNRIQNEPVYCTVCNNYFEDNNESSVEGWQWNPVKNNIIIGNGVLQTAQSVEKMREKYKIDYSLYIRKNPSQNSIYIGQYTDQQWYPAGEIRSIENNTIARSYGTRNPILIRGYFYEKVVIRNNTITDEALDTDENSKYAHFLWSTFHNGLVWENNIGMKPYFNGCQFIDGEYRIDELQDIYDCTFNSQNFEAVSKTDRFQTIRSARYNPEFATMRDNDVSNLVDGKPVLGYKKQPAAITIPNSDWDIKNENGYSNGYVFGGETSATLLDTGIDLSSTDQDWTIFVDTTTTSDNEAGDNSFIIKLLSFSNSDGSNISLEFGSRFNQQSWTWILPNGLWTYDNAWRIDGDTAKNFLQPGRSSEFVLRHKAGSDEIQVYAMRHDYIRNTMEDLYAGAYAFTSGTASTLMFGGVPNSDKPKSYYNGTIKDARVFKQALSDAQISMLMLGSDVTQHVAPTPIYDISNETNYVAETGLVMDGTTAINTEIPLLENTNDFTIITQFKYDNMIMENGVENEKPNFSFYPVFSLMSAEMADEVHTGYTDKGFDLGLSMQNGMDLSATARGGFISVRRDWRYVNHISIDDYNYGTYYNKTYTVIIRRKDGVITVYDNNLIELGKLTGDYATSIVNGNLTIGAKMGYGLSYTDFFKGAIKTFQVYDTAVDLDIIEQQYPAIADNEVSKKGAVTYHLSNKNNTRKDVRYALVEVNYDLGEYNSAEFTTQYPKAFGIRMDNIYDDVTWVPCSSSKRIVLCKRCKWDAIYDPFEDWNMDIVNPGTVPGLSIKINGVKVLLLSKQEAVPQTIDATDFHIDWEQDLTQSYRYGNVIHGHVQYIPDNASSGLTLTAFSDDPDVATVAVSNAEVIITYGRQLDTKETMIHVSIPYGTEHVYNVAAYTETLA